MTDAIPITMTQADIKSARDTSDRRIAALRANGEEPRRTVAWVDAVDERAQIERAAAFEAWKASHARSGK